MQGTARAVPQYRWQYRKKVDFALRLFVMFPIYDRTCRIDRFFFLSFFPLARLNFGNIFQVCFPRLGPLTVNFWSVLTFFQLSRLGRNFRPKTDEKFFCPEFIVNLSGACVFVSGALRQKIEENTRTCFFFCPATPPPPLNNRTIVPEFCVVEPRIWHA